MKELKVVCKNAYPDVYRTLVGLSAHRYLKFSLQVEDLIANLQEIEDEKVTEIITSKTTFISVVNCLSIS